MWIVKKKSERDHKDDTHGRNKVVGSRLYVFYVSTKETTSYDVDIATSTTPTHGPGAYLAVVIGVRTNDTPAGAA